jgi:hypothetical protein
LPGVVVPVQIIESGSSSERQDRRIVVQHLNEVMTFSPEALPLRALGVPISPRILVLHPLRPCYPRYRSPRPRHHPIRPRRGGTSDQDGETQRQRGNGAPLARRRLRFGRVAGRTCRQGLGRPLPPCAGRRK